MVSRSLYRGVSLFLLIVLLAGCNSSPNQEIQETKQRTSPAEITLTPVDLFQGDAAKFRPFLGSMTGSFQLSYEGTKPNARLEMEVWENGHPSSMGFMGDLFSSEDGEPKKVEVIITADSVSTSKENKDLMIKMGAGSGVAAFTIPRDPKLTSEGILQYHEPHSFTADEPFYVWGIQATSSGMIQTADFSPESLKQLEWGLLFKLNFEE
ncbi:hypothetical protein [Marinicrinis lubricantis]|uniref:Uncharacterized protein n=1 Tax=Marinicrinis lubricantis TaxID=2086470 RepID=A0ABW1INF6_9BACL